MPSYASPFLLLPYAFNLGISTIPPLHNTQCTQDRARKLVRGLKEEESRWLKSLSTLSSTLHNLRGDTCFAAGCVGYLGPFTATHRARITRQWAAAAMALDIPCGAFSLLPLADLSAHQGWLRAGLPADDYCRDNTLIATLGGRWPLMIDPQGTANRWIRNAHASNLRVLKMLDADFLQTFSSSVTNGDTVLLEILHEDLDPNLEFLLKKTFFQREGQTFIRLGSTDVQYNAEFKLYITTNQSNPQYTSEMYSKVSTVRAVQCV
jgi:dynein heavy chain, axonemal